MKRSKPKVWWVSTIALIFVFITGLSSISAEEILWVVKGSHMPTARSKAQAAVVGTDIYTLGGHGGPNTYSMANGMRENEVYHANSDSWEQKASIPQYRGCYAFTTAVVDNKLFMFGGGNPPGTGDYNFITMYDISNNTWTKDVAHLPYPVEGVVAAAFNGYIYIFGGRSGAESAPGRPFRKIAIKFDPNTYNYTNVNELPIYFSSLGSNAFVVDNLIYIVATVTPTNPTIPYGPTYLPPLLIYNPENDSWMIKGTVPIAGWAVLVNSTIYLLASDLSIAYKYNVSEDSWTPIFTQFPNDPTGGFAGNSCYGVVGNKIYIIGGSSYTTQRLNTVIEGTIIPDNSPPTADAGEDIATTSEEVASTIITGIASDEDAENSLEYRWKEGETILADWTPAGENGECLLYLNTVSLGIGTHTLTLEVTDGDEAASDDMQLTILNSPPNTSPSGEGIFEIHTDVTLGGYVSDFDGDLVNYQWLEGTTVLFSGTIQAINGGTVVELPGHTVSTLSLGIHAIILKVDDGINDPVNGEITIEIVDTTPPILVPVADKSTLWPPNHKMTDIAIEANASDNSGLPVTLSAVISSNEPINSTGDGDKSPDWTEPVINQESGIITFQLRAERSGNGNNRLYTITVTATDTSNNSATAYIEIIVPHDKK